MEIEWRVNFLSWGAWENLEGIEQQAVWKLLSKAFFLVSVAVV